MVNFVIPRTLTATTANSQGDAGQENTPKEEGLPERVNIAEIEPRTAVATEDQQTSRTNSDAESDADESPTSLRDTAISATIETEEREGPNSDANSTAIQQISPSSDANESDRSPRDTASSSNINSSRPSPIVVNIAVDNDAESQRDGANSAVTTSSSTGAINSGIEAMSDEAIITVIRAAFSAVSTATSAELDNADLARLDSSETSSIVAEAETNTRQQDDEASQNGSSYSAVDTPLPQGDSTTGLTELRGEMCPVPETRRRLVSLETLTAIGRSLLKAGWYLTTFCAVGFTLHHLVLQSGSELPIQEQFVIQQKPSILSRLTGNTVHGRCSEIVRQYILFSDRVDARANSQ